jgi:uncharacterized protein YndB with AHSA1/START domain
LRKGAYVANGTVSKQQHFAPPMPSYTVAREILAPLEDVWLFLAEPHHFSDWWPGVSGVHPDRRGLAPGARWKLHAGMRPSLFRRPAVESTLMVIEVEPPTRVTWYMTVERLDVELGLSDAGSHRTRAELTVSGPFLVGLRRSLPRNALNRLHALCQTAAEL